MESVTHYEVLQVLSTASQAEIKTAYRKLVKKYHPDISRAADARDKIRRINEAYEVLSNIYSRRIYDLTLSGQISATYSETPEEKYDREFRAKMAREERENMERMVHINAFIYRMERILCLIFAVFGLLFIIDYYGVSESFTIDDYDRIQKNQHATIIYWPNGEERYIVRDEFFSLLEAPKPIVQVQVSAIFGNEASLTYRDSERFYLINSVYTYANFWTYLMLIACARVLLRRTYNEVGMTAGFVACFLFIIQFGMTV